MHTKILTAEMDTITEPSSEKSCMVSETGGHAWIVCLQLSRSLENDVSRICQHTESANIQITANMAFIDFTKALDKVIKPKLWEIYLRIGKFLTT